jgi:hypothetical protein
MILKKTSLAMVALAAALALSPPGAVQAGALPGPASEVQTDNIVKQIRKKAYHKLYWPKTQPPAADPTGAPAKESAAQKATAKSVLCGTYKSWDKKAKKCIDARDKKK